MDQNFCTPNSDSVPFAIPAPTSGFLPLDMTEKDLPQWYEEGGNEDAGRWG